MTFLSTVHRSSTISEPSLWQRVQHFLGLEDSPAPAESGLQHSDHYQSSGLGKAPQQIVNLSRFELDPASAVQSQQTLQLSPQTRQSAQPLSAPQHWQNLYLPGTAPAQWPHQLAPATQALQTLERDGRLNQALLQALNELEQTPLTPELSAERQNLIQSVLQDIAFPESIMQGNKNTCVSTVAEMKLALEDPVKYVRILTALVSPAGKAPCELVPPAQSQDSLSLEPTALAPDQSGRSLSQRLFQAALSEYANGSLDYDNRSDLSQDLQGHTQNGLYGPQNLQLMNALFAGQYQEFSLKQGFSTADLAQRIEHAVQAGVPISTGMRWGTGGHQVLVMGMDAHQVHLLNPQSMGQGFSLSRQDFEAHLLSAALPTMADPSLKARSNLPTRLNSKQPQIATSNYPNLPAAALLSPHEYLQRKFPQLPERLQLRLTSSWNKTGLQSRHFYPLEPVLKGAADKLQAPYLDTLADLTSTTALSSHEAGLGVLQLNRFVAALWQRRGSAGVEQANRFLQTLRQAGLQTVWADSTKSEKLLSAAQAGQLSPALVQSLQA